MADNSPGAAPQKDYWRMTPSERRAHDIGETICEWKSGVGGEPLWVCEECDGKIAAGSSVHFLSDGGYDSREGTYIGPCCIDKFFPLDAFPYRSRA